MNAEDLHIGNWAILDWVGDKCPCGDVIEITNFQVLKEFEEGKRQYSGILLTDTWLERCGAEKISDDDNYEKEFMLTGEFYIREDKNSGIYYYDDTPLQFVHQLQNVYFLLKRKKLVFKNK